jgi:type I restriction enzyme S subunit
VTQNNVNSIKLPNGWVWVRFGDIAVIAAGNPAPQGDEYFDNGKFPFVRVRDMGKIGNNIYLQDTIDLINEKALERLNLFPKGTVLFTKSGMSILLNQRAILGKDMYVVSHIGVANPLDSIPSELLFYWLKTIDFKDLTHATTLPSLQLTKVSNIPFPLPPLPEQHRIVEKIEELFTRLDDGVAELKKVQLQLKRYRQSILKSAFDGTLTAEWREEHKAELEPASMLLERIKSERGQNSKNKALPLSEKLNLKDLPEGWVWTTYNQIGQWFGGGTPSKENSLYWENGTIPWVSPKDMKDIKITQTEDKITSVALNNSPVHVVPSGSLLFVVRSGIIRRTLPIALNLVDVTVNQDLKALVPSPQIFPDYLLYLTLSLSEAIRKDCSKGGTTVESIEFPLLKNYIMPLTSIKEQKYIVEKIEVCLSVSDEIEVVIEESIKQAERLRQSILKKAFEGKLVPQDPSDEPADKLLARIKVENTKIKMNSKRGRAVNVR